jgi:hypothetical protein
MGLADILLELQAEEFKVKTGGGGKKRKRKGGGGYQSPYDPDFPQDDPMPTGGQRPGGRGGTYGAVGRAIEAGARPPWENTRIGPSMGPPVEMPRYRRGRTRRA